MNKKIELLCPAGSMTALEAAIDGGADAVYFGGSGFNARMNAANFSSLEIKEAIEKCHTYGVKAYITQNTLCFDREMKDYLHAAEEAYLAGVDALIVADLGGAAAIHRCLPELALHASTQMSGHNINAAKMLADAGFSRMVCAREMSREDLRTFVGSSPIEAEVFVHGALCVCHSGQCLFSSLVGNRSGNRGECAQPCRLPYSNPQNPKNKYPLSLKDLSLAGYIPELVDMGIASLKIEGRMKSPEYVREVTKVFRTLLDEGRAADQNEMQYLAEIFSRGGFTDGYYTKNIGRKMLGVRSDEDKKASRELPKFKSIERRIPIDMYAVITQGKNMTLRISGNGKEVTVSGEVPMEAINAPLDRETVSRNLCKLGATPYTAGKVEILLDDGLMLPLSKLNALRRDAIEKFSAARLPENPQRTADPRHVLEYSPKKPSGSCKMCRSARFYSSEQIPENAKEAFEIIYLPLQNYSPAANGVVLPPVIFDSEADEVCAMLKKAKDAGAVHALVGNLGHIALAKKYGFCIHGDFRLNVTNNESVAAIEAMGVEDVILSPELTLPQIRDIGGNTSAVTYGRIPLMVVEKCVSGEISDCRTCQSGQSVLRDRRNISFPVLREWKHRNVIYNSLPTYMEDKADELRKYRIESTHFIFSNESREEAAAVIRAALANAPLGREVRRIKA